MSDKPHILFLSQSLPYPPHSGVTSRTFNIVKQLASAFRITLLAFSRRNHQRDAAARGAAEEALRGVVTTVYPSVPIPSEQSALRKTWDHVRSLTTGQPYFRYLHESRHFARNIEAALEESRPDLIHVDSLVLHRWLDSVPVVPTTCTHHDIESDHLRLRAEREESALVRRYMQLQAARIERLERELSPRFDVNVMMSQLDADRLRAIVPGVRTVVVPNGVDTELFTPLRERPVAEGRVVFLGPTYVFPNRDAVRFLLSSVWPSIVGRRQAASLHLLGAVRDADRAEFQRHPNVSALGFVEDLRAHLAEAACCVVPLRVGGGTRLKILDYWAMGKAVVSTTLGCEGLDAVDGENILIRDDPEAIADAVLTVLSDSALRERLGRNARATAESTYSWDVIGHNLRATYTGLLNDPATAQFAP